MQKALLVGLTSVDSTRYGGWTGTNGCGGCELDVDNVGGIVTGLKFETSILKTKQATSGNILAGLRQAAESLKAGDIFVFYYSGHGGQQPDANGDETDGQDETLVAYDRQIIDDELNAIWPTFKSGVRILMLSDSCNSGTNYRNRFDILSGSSIQPIPDLKTASLMQAQMIHMGGCRDGDTSSGYSTGGEFTTALCKTWNKGAFSGNYRAFYQQILTLITSGQQPQFNEYGPVTDTFRNQKPFETSDRCWEPMGPGPFEGLRGTSDVMGFRTGPDEKEVVLNLTLRGSNEEALAKCIGNLGPWVLSEIARSNSREPRPCTFSGSVSTGSGGGWSGGGSVHCNF